MISFKRIAAAAALAAAIASMLAGCSTTTETPAVPAPQAEAESEAAAEARLEPLMSAADRSQTTCDSVTPLSVQTALSEMQFHCKALNAKATLIEMYDAGWRLEEVDIGHESNQGGVITMPLKITIRKLF